MENNSIELITWGNEIRRSESLAREVNANYIWFKRRFSNKYLNYVYYLYKTIIHILRSKGVDIYILVLPPTLLLYTVPFIKLKNKSTKIVLDMHNGVIRPEWLKIPFLRYIIDKCNVVISHNSVVKYKIDTAFSCNSIVLSDPLIKIKENSSIELNCILESKINVFVPVSYAKDEPIDIVLEVAHKMKETHNFILSGNYRKYFKYKEIPTYVKFTGFIDKDMYFSYLSISDIVLCLTLDNEIQMCAVIESISYKKKIVCSDNEVNRTLFRSIPMIRAKIDVDDLIRCIGECENVATPTVQDLEEYMHSWIDTKHYIFNG